MTARPGKQMANILSIMSRSKGNQIMKCSQLIEYNMRNIFLEKSYAKVFPDSFLKIQNWAYLWINNLKFCTVCFYCISCWGLSKYIETMLQITWLYLIKSFFKNNKRSGNSLLASISAWFLKKNISLIIFHQLAKFHCLVAFTSWDIGQYVYWNCLLTSLWRHKFWHWPYIFNKAVFSTWPKSQEKNSNILRTKRWN